MSPTPSIRALFSMGDEFATGEIAAMAGISLEVARSTVWRMVGKGELTRIGKTVPAVYRSSAFSHSATRLTTVQYAMLTQPRSVFHLGANA